MTGFIRAHDDTGWLDEWGNDVDVDLDTVGSFDDLQLALVLVAADEALRIAERYEYLHAVVAARFALPFRMLDDVEAAL